MTANLLVFAGLAGLLFPAGVVLWAGAAAPGGSKAAGRGPGFVLAALAVGLVGYVAVGFGLSFGGAAGLYPGLGELAALGKHWTPLAVFQGPDWALAGASGFFVMVGDDPGAYALFFYQASLLAAALALLAVSFAGRLRPQFFAFLVMLFGWLLYPLAVAWMWGGGWLATLGGERALGHGFVDAGAGGVLLIAGAAALAGAVARPRASGDVPAALPVELPEALSAGALAGLAAMAVGWLGLLAGAAIMMGTSLPLVAVNALAGGAAGAAVALGYMGFTTTQLHAAMGGRGLLAGIFAAGVAAHFVSTPAALLIGAVAGLLACWTTYLTARRRIDDAADVLSVGGMAGVWGLVALGLFADGRTGVGWHGVGLSDYLGAAGQGVTGLWPVAGFVPDPPQLAAQLVGIAALFVWVFLPVLLFMRFGGPAPEAESPAGE